MAKSGKVLGRSKVVKGGNFSNIAKPASFNLYFSDEPHILSEQNRKQTSGCGEGVLSQSRLKK